MPKKVIKRNRIKPLSVLLLIIAAFFAYFLGQAILSFPIQNIYIEGTKYLGDEYILDTAQIADYPSFVKNLSWVLEKRLEDSPYIEKASVHKGFLGVVEISIQENPVLFYKEYDHKYVLKGKEEVEQLPYSISPIRIMNSIPLSVYSTFVDRFPRIDEEVLNKISEIKYDPSEYDDSRFLFYMTDGNYVYTTITKFENVNYYNEIYPTLEGKKGTLYLDSGNHFQEFTN